MAAGHPGEWLLRMVPWLDTVSNRQRDYRGLDLEFESAEGRVDLAMMVA